MKDGFFRGSFSNLAVARQFLQAWLPTELCASLDWETLELCKISGINEALAERREDLVFRISGADCELRIYVLLEHQTQAESGMALRVMEYIGLVWQQHRGESRKGGASELGVSTLLKLPMVVPLVLYPGPGKWGPVRRLRDLIDVPCGLEGWAAEFLPDCGFLVAELDCVEWEQIAVGPLARAVLGALVGERHGPMGFEEVMRIVSEFFADEDADAASRLSGMLWTFLLGASELREEEVRIIVSERIPPEKQEEFMSTAELLKEEGRKEGRKEGRVEALREAVLELLEARFSALPRTLKERIAVIEDIDRLRALLRAAHASPDLAAFEALMER